MPVLPRHLIPWVFILTVVIVGVVGFSGEAVAQVYQGPLSFEGLPTVTITLTLHPGGPATYRMDFAGRIVDTGIFVAFVSGSSVRGFVQSNQPCCNAPCFFQGNYDGTTATLVLDPVTCGAAGTLTLTRIA